jgi:hypothetical protein
MSLQKVKFYDKIPLQMEGPHENKVWYKKKRYIIPAGLLGLLLISSSGDSPAESLEQQVVNSPQVSMPANLLEETVEVSSKPLTKPETTSSCNPNYSGCLKSGAGDYDCAGGSGNGPYYTGKIQVIGYDEYGLDRDGDGWGCE